MSTQPPVPPKEGSSRFPFHYALLLVAVPSLMTLLGLALGTSSRAFHYALLLVAVPSLMTLLGLALGTSAVATAAMAIIALVVVFAGVGTLMRRRGFERRPGRHPVRPPSAS